jgi:hypothetical protein
MFSTPTNTPKVPSYPAIHSAASYSPGQPAMPRRGASDYNTPGFICDDARIHLGATKVPTSKITDDLNQLSLLCRAAREFFKDTEIFNQALHCVGTPHLPCSAPIPESLNAVRRLLAGSDIQEKITTTNQRLGYSSRGKSLSTNELTELRELLFEGALICTALSAFDNATLTTPARRFTSIFRVGKNTLKPIEDLVSAYRQSLPFDRYLPDYLRANLDKTAQRIRNQPGGCPEIARECQAEHRAKEILLSGTLHRKVSISAENVLIDLVLQSSEKPTPILEGDVQIPRLFEVLTLAERNAKFLEQLQSDEKVDLTRLCAIAHRGAGIEMRIHLTQLSPAASDRLSTVLDWSPLFESGSPRDLTVNEQQELAALLLDAEAVLNIMGTLQNVFGQTWSAKWWQSQWRRGIDDNDIRAALKLLVPPAKILDLDYVGASQLAKVGALALGYSQEDREGKGFNTPENPLHSVSFLMLNQAA